MKKRMILGLFACLLVIIIIAINAIMIAPKKINIRFETLTSTAIGENLNDITIVFFSDLHYNNFITEERTLNIINKINELHPDIVLFGGDLIDHPSENILDQTEYDFIIEQLSNIEAPLGKYAVVGNHDAESENTLAQFRDIMRISDFEVLINQAIQIRNGGQDYFNLIGIDTMANGTPNIDASYQNISPLAYTVALSHTPDLFDSVPKDLTNYMLSGHSHGGQIYIPLVGSFYKPYGAEYYFRGKHTVSNTTLDITNGVGTTKEDVRLFAPAEIVHYTLKTEVATIE